MRLSRFPISTLLDSASGHLEAHLYKKRLAAESGEPLAQQYSGIIFSGNPHETVPRRLLLDKRLTPLERNCWQVFRLLINDDGLTAFPTYEQLRPYLGMQPGKIASRETIAKALKVLRLTRWLSLGRRLRNDLNGQVQGNVYILHDEPVACYLRRAPCAFASAPITWPYPSLDRSFPRKGDRFIFTTLISATVPTLNYSKQITR